MAKRKYWEPGDYPAQPTAEELRERADETAKKATSKGKVLSPVVISGRNIAKSWWGRAWCENLERYADYDTRLPRGKNYVRAGAVVDLQIQKGKITARVQGTRRTPYKVEIRISPLSEERCQQIMDRCGRRADSLENLLGGSFPEELKDVFLDEGGLFPSPKEISFNCSCPDWALMCKHVAATLYGVGARLDDDPTLFFSLRGIDTDRFIDVVIANRVESMLANVNKPSGRIIEGCDLTKLFGVL